MRELPEWRRLPWLVRYRKLAVAASDARRLAAMATHLHADVVFEGPVYLGPGFALRIPEPATLRIGAGVDLRRQFVCELAEGARVVIGPGCTFTGMALIQCTTSIEIGHSAILGQGLMMADGNHRFRDPDQPFMDQGYDFRPVTIGAGAVVHTSCTVTHDIGERAVIAANSVVTKPVPAYCLAVGNPARVIEYFGPPERREEILGKGRAG
jgi:acetyltransferase-like isoleucine patch superfamily enzyme